MPRQVRNAFLEAMVPIAGEPFTHEVRELPLDVLEPNPWQPRQHYDEAKLAELATGITQAGVIEPLIVRQHPTAADRFQIVAGERRLRAARLAGLGSVPCVIRRLDDKQTLALSLIENSDREDMDPEDEGRAYIMLRDQAGLSLREIGALINRSHNYVNRRIHLVADPDALLAYREGRANLVEILAGDLEPAPGSEAPTGSETVTLSNSTTDGSAVTESNTMPSEHLEEVRFLCMESLYKPLHKVVMAVRRVDLDRIPEDERGAYERVLGNTIQELQQLAARLKAQQSQ